jgi:hypothetical protein
LILQANRRRLLNMGGYKLIISGFTGCSGLRTWFFDNKLQRRFPGGKRRFMNIRRRNR